MSTMQGAVTRLDDVHTFDDIVVGVAIYLNGLVFWKRPRERNDVWKSENEGYPQLFGFTYRYL